MEKTIIKTIREAFKKAYISKLLKEDSEKLGKKLNPDMFQKAEELYPLWISGRKNLKYGKGVGYTAQDTLNYLIEKAVEEYKQTKDDRLRQAIAKVFYPTKGGFLWVRLTYNNPNESRIDENLRKAYGDVNMDEYMDDLIANSWENTLGTPTEFDKTINRYQGDTTKGGTGIGGLFFYTMATEMLSLSSEAKAAKRGGGSVGYRFGHSKAGQSDDPIMASAGAEDFGSDVATVDDFDIADTGEETSAEKSMAAAMAPEKLRKTFDEIKNTIEQSISQTSNAKNPKIKFVLMNLFNGKKPSETYAENPEFFAIPGKTEKQIRNEVASWPTLYFSQPFPEENKKGSKLYYTANDIGVKNGLPDGWLKFIMDQKKFIEVAKFLKDPGLNESEDKKLLRLILGLDTNSILKEVYRRLKQK